MEASSTYEAERRVLSALGAVQRHLDDLWASRPQGFGLELADALLPALQSILEVFGDLFEHQDQDWSALFEVIKVGLRSCGDGALRHDQAGRSACRSRSSTASTPSARRLQGDFAAAGRALSQGFGAGLEQAKRDFRADWQAMWTDAPAPGTGSGRRSRSRAWRLGDLCCGRPRCQDPRSCEPSAAASEQERCWSGAPDADAASDRAAGSNCADSVADVTAALHLMVVGASPDASS
jgi:hypothetical protein